ncbi:MAG: DNA translocase FtsK 4TM domain-containing protein [Bacteroidia bacterium]
MASKENKLKGETKKPVEKKPAKENVFKRSFSAVKLFLENKQLHAITGSFLILFAGFLLVSFISYFYNWAIDFSAVTSENPDTGVANKGGWLGAKLVHRLIYSGFGITSFIIPFLLLLLGIRITFKVALLPFGKIAKHSIFFFYWLPLTLSYFLTEDEFGGGSVGRMLNNKLALYIGSAGAILLIIFSALVYSVLVFSLSFENVFARKPKEEEPTPETEVAENNIEEDDELPHKENVLIVKEPEVKPETNTVEFAETKPVTKNEKTDGVDFEITQTSVEEVAAATGANEITAENLVDEVGEYDPTLELSQYKFPPIDLLEDYVSQDRTVSEQELNSNKDKILQTLNNYGIEIDKIKATIGPTVTLYEIVPAAGVRISKIKNLEDDIALSLAALGIRIIAPIPGKGTIGIEVPNSSPDIVSMRSMIASEKFQNVKMDLPIALGKTISNESFIADLAKMPHLLMAGATGQGKSVGLNAILVSLLYKKHPSQIKFVLVDPKKVELTLFNKIERHFLAKLPDSAEAIITDTKKVINTLNSLCIEMDMRYDLLKNASVRTIKEYNAKFVSRKLNPNEGHRFLPYIVLVVDEFADLIMTAGKDVEMPIARLAQLARAIGIHLIIATQRPSVNIITGTIKANFPARIAFRVTSRIDSRTILDAGGADQLIGRGDMLLSTGSDMIRLQCAFVDTPEVEKITEFIGSQMGYPDAMHLPEIIDDSVEGGGGEYGDPDERDAMFVEAARMVVQHQQGSASLLQRRLKLGYNRAGRIIDQLEMAGIVGPNEGSKARQVLFPTLESLEQYLKTIG